MAIKRDELFTLSHYEYGEAFFGSHRGMRFRVAREPFKDVHFLSADEKADGRLKCTLWAGPYAYGETKPSLMTDMEFDFSEEGMTALLEWMNDQYTSRSKEWAE